MSATAASVWAWVDSYDLTPTDSSRKHLERTETPWIASLFYPQARPHVLPLLMQHLAWAFIVDDQFDDGPVGRDVAQATSAVAELRAQLATTTAPAGSRPARALRDIWTRAVPRRSQGWIEQFRNSIDEWLESLRRDAEDRRHDHRPTIAEYRQRRRYGSGMPMFFDLAELALGVDADPLLRALPEYSRARLWLAEWIGVHNDIYMARKDLEIDPAHNAVCIIHRTERRSLEQSLVAVSDMANDCMTRYLECERDCLAAFDATAPSARARADAARCFVSYRQVCRACFDIEGRTRRYRNASDYLAAARNSRDEAPDWTAQRLFGD
ncbi:MULTISPECIES: terpene synthase family protein [unclassified Nocardia]|uniref:terpene synthase family protein n=1 Tax=unclassified Nocardia TaxID=2637762 RepID=UPI0024A9F077|nr:MULTISPECIES: terpene synthase family protein [unclassified Nocardia]